MWKPDLQKVIERRNFVVLDTETTGIEPPAEICQIAIVDHQGKTLMSTLVRPQLHIPIVATNVHGITDAKVSGSPIWPDVRPEVMRLISGKDVIVYNASFDRKLMHWSDERYGDDRIDYKADAQWYCAMLAYAEYYGQINQYYGSYKWQTLTNALIQQGLDVANAHDALSDCLSTLRLLWAIARDL